MVSTKQPIKKTVSQDSRTANNLAASKMALMFEIMREASQKLEEQKQEENNPKRAAGR